jgi:hypothetical protein
MLGYLFNEEPARFRRMLKLLYYISTGGAEENQEEPIMTADAEARIEPVTSRTQIRGFKSRSSGFRYHVVMWQVTDVSKDLPACLQDGNQRRYRCDSPLHKVPYGLKHNAEKMYRGVKVQFHVFQTSVLDGGDWSG